MILTIEVVIALRNKTNLTAKAPKNWCLVAKLAIIARRTTTNKAVCITDHRIARSSKQLPHLHTIIAGRKRTSHLKLTEASFYPHISLAPITTTSGTIFCINRLLIIKTNLKASAQILYTAKANPTCTIVYNGIAMHLSFNIRTLYAQCCRVVINATNTKINNAIQRHRRLSHNGTGSGQHSQRNQGFFHCKFSKVKHIRRRPSETLASALIWTRPTPRTGSHMYWARLS